jgi:hypothetical protein
MTKSTQVTRVARAMVTQRRTSRFNSPVGDLAIGPRSSVHHEWCTTSEQQGSTDGNQRPDPANLLGLVHATGKSGARTAGFNAVQVPPRTLMEAPESGASFVLLADDRV